VRFPHISTGIKKMKSCHNCKNINSKPWCNYNFPSLTEQEQYQILMKVVLTGLRQRDLEGIAAKCAKYEVKNEA
jgi:hypothetical protein